MRAKAQVGVLCTALGQYSQQNVPRLPLADLITLCHKMHCHGYGYSHMITHAIVPVVVYFPQNPEGYRDGSGKNHRNYIGVGYV